MARRAVAPRTRNERGERIVSKKQYHSSFNEASNALFYAQGFTHQTADELIWWLWEMIQTRSRIPVGRDGEGRTEYGS